MSRQVYITRWKEAASYEHGKGFPHAGGQAAEVNISPKISISAQPLKMALHRNPAMHGSRMVIFLHDSKKAPF